MENNLSLGMTSNVQIKLFDKKSKRLLQVKNIHNKANKSMVDGLLGFLQGNFTGSVINKDTSSYKARDAWRYIPCYVYAGDGGVNVTNHKYKGCVELSKPGFHDTSLTRRLYTPATIDKTFEADYLDLEEQDSAAIFLEAQFTEYDLVRDPDDPDVYLDRTYKVSRNWDPYSVGSEATEKTGSLITEVALYSNKVENNGRMLARVVFDDLSVIDEQGYPDEESAIDKNRIPIFKTDDEFMVITWRIAIVSIGINDPIIPPNN